MDSSDSEYIFGFDLREKCLENNVIFIETLLQGISDEMDRYAKTKDAQRESNGMRWKGTSVDDILYAIDIMTRIGLDPYQLYLYLFRGHGLYERICYVRFFKLANYLYHDSQKYQSRHDQRANVQCFMNAVIGQEVFFNSQKFKAV